MVSIPSKSGPESGSIDAPKHTEKKGKKKKKKKKKKEKKIRIRKRRRKRKKKRKTKTKKKRKKKRKKKKKKKKKKSADPTHLYSVHFTEHDLVVQRPTVRVLHHHHEAMAWIYDDAKGSEQIVVSDSPSNLERV